MVNYKEIIESRYNRQNWLLLLRDIFGNKAKFWSSPSEVSTSSPFAQRALWLGTITLSDAQTIAVYEVELADNVDIERNRRGIRDMLLSAWRNNGNAGAFMFCYRKDESVLRFSYVSESWTFADDGTLKKESTDTKRFTYLLGEGHRSRTAIQQFEKLRDSALALKDLTKAFSVEAVSDMFFRGYKQQYENIIYYVTGKRMVKVANKWEERQEGTPNTFLMEQFAHFPNPEKAIRDYVKKLMGRLVFLQYLQKKGWLGVPVSEAWGEGDAEFIQHLFERCTDKDHFIDNVLEALFNDLNTERTNDLAAPAVGKNIRVPYLNGGLFERESTDETQFPLPASYMQSLLDFFSSYNFTIDENDPDDAEVGVDPEMLGRIFENLLEDNKDKGAFYTPKEIVQYMCRESLIAYLQTDVDDEPTKEAIREFVTNHDASVLGNIAEDIDQLLKDVKICDPAIGSGAFPMGLLKELFLCRTAIEGFSPKQAAAIKKHIIQQNIYGVDIERGAVDIARLRFWLSLIVDEETPQALPNLDFKIMQGNSLLEQYKGVDLSETTELTTEKQGAYQLSWFDNDLDVLRQSLRDKLEEYYNCPDHKVKRELKREIVANVKQQLKEQKIDVDFGDLDLSGNDQFMLWHTWFHDVFAKGGFDIVIGNPPYVNVQLMSTSDKKIYQNTFKSFYKRCDMFCLFLELGLLPLSSTQGIVTLIIPSVVHSNMSYQKIRDILLNNKWLQEVHYTGGDVFNAPTVDTTILICNKNDNKKITLTDAVDFAHPKSHQVPADYFKKYNNVISIGDDNGSEIFDKLFNTQFDVVGDHYNVFQGIVTGNNPAFIFDTESEAKVKNIDLSLLHPLCHGRDLEKYKVRSRERRILYIDNDIDIDDYPKTKEWLLGFKDRLKERREAKRGVINWYGLQWPRVKFELDNNEKILMQNTRNEALKTRMVATLDDCSVYGTQGINFVIPKNEENSLRYLLGILNSKLINYLFATKFLNLAIKAEYVKQVRIPNATNEQKSQMETLVNMVLDSKKNNEDTIGIEREIDQLVYQLYGLTEDEIKIVEGTN